MKIAETLLGLATCATGLPFACGMPRGTSPLDSAGQEIVGGVIEQIEFTRPALLEAIEVSSLNFDNSGDHVTSSIEVARNVEDTLSDLRKTFDENQILTADEDEMRRRFGTENTPVYDLKAAFFENNYIVIFEPYISRGNLVLSNILPHEQGHSTYDGGECGHDDRMNLCENSTVPNTDTIISYSDYSYTIGFTTHDALFLQEVANGNYYRWNEYTAIENVSATYCGGICIGETNFCNYDDLFHSVCDNPVAAYFLLQDLYENADTYIRDEIFNFYDEYDVEEPRNTSSFWIFPSMGTSPEELGQIVTNNPDIYIAARQSTINGMQKQLFANFGEELAAVGIFE